MDHRSIVAVVSSGETTVHADQVIFTSIRSPTGEGYRIGAASPGVRSDEKRMIMQRSPSHASLCDESPTAVACSFYRLSTGRHCVASSRYAGVEHTGRGGQRVYTHLVLLDDEIAARPDIWIAARLCDQVLASMLQATG